MLTNKQLAAGGRRELKDSHMAELPTISIGEGLLLKGDSVRHIPLCLIAVLSLQPLVRPLFCTLAPFHDRTGVLECKQMYTNKGLSCGLLCSHHVSWQRGMCLLIVVVNVDSG